MRLNSFKEVKYNNKVYNIGDEINWSCSILVSNFWRGAFRFFGVRAGVFLVSRVVARDALLPLLGSSSGFKVAQGCLHEGVSWIQDCSSGSCILNEYIILYFCGKYLFT